MNPLIHKNYFMFMSCNAETDGFLFPVTPENIKLTDSIKNTSVNITSFGETTVIEEKGADTISFSCRFPQYRDQAVVVATLYDPKYYYDKLEKWRGLKKPVHFIFTCGFEIDGYYTIEKLDFSEKGGEPGTIICNMELKLYRAPTTRKIDLSQDGTKAEVTKEKGRVDNTVQEATYTVVKGDSLYKIAKAKLGDGSKWKEIYNLNKDKIKDPNVIQIGQVFKLPSSSK